MFGIIQKKGNENKLCGRVIGYVKVPKPAPGSGDETPFDALVSPDGILAIQGDYSKHPDFESFRNNLQQTLPKGLQEILKHILEDDDIRDNMDKSKKISVSIIPQKNSRMGDFFPVPAQLVPFQSEEILLNEECDIYFLGEFSSLGSAHLFLTGFPILYQSKYKEQSELEKEKEIDLLLAEIDGGKSEPKAIESNQNFAISLDGELSDYKGNLLELLGAQILPKLMYAIEENDLENFKAGINSFRRFMHAYPHQQDIEKMVSILESINETKQPNSKDSKNLALLCQKISALHHEEFEILPGIQKELEDI
ncbi:MAG: hypothetical protein FWH22_04285 [Fibromonadales bacterium]|nr:hypothetical protein [Fibromonadales bacterium]